MNTLIVRHRFKFQISYFEKRSYSSNVINISLYSHIFYDLSRPKWSIRVSTYESNILAFIYTVTPTNLVNDLLKTFWPNIGHLPNDSITTGDWFRVYSDTFKPLITNELITDFYIWETPRQYRNQGCRCNCSYLLTLMADTVIEF